MKHILSASQFRRIELEALFKKADKFLSVVKEKSSLDLMKGKILATLFFEPSTRTRFSFETAMIRLGGGVISNYKMKETSSAWKGETNYDTAKTVSKFANVMVIRHPEEGIMKEFKRGAEVPIINAGEGGLEHPTQALLDLYTIYQEKGKIDGLKIGLVGDLKDSRVLKSQVEILKKFENVQFFVEKSCCDLLETGVLSDYLENFKEGGFEVNVISLSEMVNEVDVLSTTRLQFERKEEVNGLLEPSYVINKELLEEAKKDMIILAPLPRSGEITEEVDLDERAKYFDQLENGVAMRMAVLEMVLGK